MRVITTEKVPIKLWLEDIEEAALVQARNLANLPFTFKWVALMPDAHVGYGMPIGGVLATKGVVISNAVGLDIGCGVAFVQTNIPADILQRESEAHGTLGKGIVGNIKRNVPVGFSHHNTKQPCTTLDIALTEKFVEHPLAPQLERGYFQIGTLGGGNHFIELQRDVATGNLGIMLHSGSRNFGKQVCDFFNKRAKALNELWYSQVTSDKGLSFLPLDTEDGQWYMRWMRLALDFAAENRARMMRECLSVVFNMVKKYDGFSGIEAEETIDIHHNYAAMEHHYGENVMVHRKGATKAVGIGIIPGSMGSKSYIVRGLSKEESFKSCSHGAGRRMGRKEAQRSLNLAAEQEIMKGILHDMTSVAKLEEAPSSYKDIDVVMNNQKDLVEIVKTLRPVAVIKG